MTATHRYDGRERRLRGSALQKMRKRVAQEQPLCPDCQKAGRITAWYPDGHLDHITPIAKGGGNERSNLEGVCIEHNEARRRREFGIRERRRGVDADGWPLD